MATGWAGDGAVQDQIDATVEGRDQARAQPAAARARAEHCEECDAPIPEARRKAVPGVRLCVACQEAHDREQRAVQRLQPPRQQGQPAALSPACRPPAEHAMTSPSITIELATSDTQIAATFDIMHQLRPQLERATYVGSVRSLMASDGFRLAVLRDVGEVRAVAGYRLMNMLYCGRLLYIDDLVSDERVRSRGYGAGLLEWLREHARSEGCSEVQLISRVTEQAHRFYFREGFGIECFHFRTRLNSEARTERAGRSVRRPSGVGCSDCLRRRRRAP